ncbi:MAG: recombinase family protein [Candidatus Paceibacterota bacterium]
MNTTNQTALKRCVIYVRVSTKEQADEGNSLVTQERICREYANKNDYEINEVFVEQGESAKTADRTELQKLLKYCAEKKNGIRAVIIYKLDRLSRNTDDYSQIRLLLKRYGVEIKSTSEYFENNPVGRFMENTMANIAQFDNDIRAERSTNGMKEAVRDGRYVWMAPIGYLNAKVNGKATIVKDSKIAPIVHKTFTLVASNVYTTEEVRKMMTKKGLANKSGKPFSKGYFYTILRNELYCGRIIKFGAIYNGLYPAIISEEIFDQAQRVLKNKGHKHSTHITDHPDFPLRRFVINEIGKKLTGSWSKGRDKKYPYYRFGGKDTNYNRDKFENDFVKFLDKYSLDSSKIEKLKLAIKKNFSKKFQETRNNTEKLKRQIQVLKYKQTSVIKKNLEGFIQNEVLKEQLELIDQELLELNSQLVAMPSLNIDILSIMKELEEYFRNPSQVWRDAPIETKIRLQWFQFPKGLTFKNSAFGTIDTSFLFKLKSSISDIESSRVRRVGFEPT